MYIDPARQAAELYVCNGIKEHLNISCFVLEPCINATQLKDQHLGTKSTAISGRICQNCSVQSPHRHGGGAEGNPNFCRNNWGWEGGPWCHTTDPNVRFEACFSACETTGKFSAVFASIFLLHASVVVTASTAILDALTKRRVVISDDEEGRKESKLRSELLHLQIQNLILKNRKLELEIGALKQRPEWKAQRFSVERQRTSYNNVLLASVFMDSFLLFVFPLRFLGNTMCDYLVSQNLVCCERCRSGVVHLLLSIFRHSHTAETKQNYCSVRYRVPLWGPWPTVW